MFQVEKDKTWAAVVAMPSKQRLNMEALASDPSDIWAAFLIYRNSPFKDVRARLERTGYDGARLEVISRLSPDTFL